MSEGLDWVQNTGDQITVWQPIDDSQGATWTPVNDGNTVIWTEIPT